MATTAQDALAHEIKRNVVLGTLFCFVLTVVICLPAGIGWGRAVAVALLPAGFAGPFVGGLASVVAWVLAEQRQADASVAAVIQVPAEAPAVIARPAAIPPPELTPSVAQAMAS